MERDKQYFIFFDIDGTIYHPQSGVTDDAKNAIQKLKEAGHKVFICTGRSRSGIEEEITNIGFDGIIAACGLYIEIDGKVIKNVHLPKETLDWVINNVASNEGLSVILEGSNNIYMDESRQTEEDAKRYSKFIQNNRKRIKTFNDEIMNINKFGLRVINHDNIDSLVEEISNKDFDIVLHASKTYEVIPNGYNKAIGIFDVIKCLGGDMKYTVGCGDSNNDIPMLKEVEIAIVPENGVPEAKKYADILTDDILNFGLTNAFEKLGFIKN